MKALRGAYMYPYIYPMEDRWRNLGYGESWGHYTDGSTPKQEEKRNITENFRARLLSLVEYNLCVIILT